MIAGSAAKSCLSSSYPYSLTSAPETGSMMGAVTTACNAGKRREKPSRRYLANQYGMSVGFHAELTYFSKRIERSMMVRISCSFRHCVCPSSVNVTKDSPRKKISS